MQITVQDLPKVIQSAKAAASAPGSTIPSALTFAAHSFLEPQPTIADVYLYRMVFHNWSDAGARKILSALQPALRHGSRVILIEYVMPKMGTAPDYAELQTRRLDNTMYSLMNGKVRELDEFKALFAEVEPRLKFDSYKAGQARATHDPRSHSVMSWVFEDPEPLPVIENVKAEKAMSSIVEAVQAKEIEVPEVKTPHLDAAAEIVEPKNKTSDIPATASNPSPLVVQQEEITEPESSTSPSLSSCSSSPRSVRTPEVETFTLHSKQEPLVIVAPSGTSEKVVVVTTTTEVVDEEA